ncbi:nucleotidyltransferase domain-containing protein [Candidatus Nitronereus thalassa]|uniref:Nucleotidyltransferase domain-containing protein n=1 Tax=Candidatus Nitronereus thalassa TaxID=3020898 RepID=A0ABU3K8P1_9BACT|nr:nucleotidyltransferase domain-containing protein [Candidatus Nitronereus thalassa]MDT7042683.1 nucleotidyltransferase domain-containing protein [Candidatus Nitronereus thalassa]
MNFLRTRRDKALARLKKLQIHLKEAHKLSKGKVCVYVTGSFGRGEASNYSDLDLFIVGKEEKNFRVLSNLDEILVKAELIKATRKLNFPEFSGDGEYLKHYTVGDLVASLGKPDDDATNTFTARLLLLLESRPLLEEQIHKQAINSVINAYWRDFRGHESEFVPAFLVNDIIRLWRTFCVNYEARTQTSSDEKRAKRKLKNYKLKHSRLITCYSAIFYLMATMGKKDTVTQYDAKKMVYLSPIERLEWLLGEKGFTDFSSKINEILSLYQNFLTKTDQDEKTLVKLFLNDKKSREYLREANKLGDHVFELLRAIGERQKPFNKIFRILNV